jgi:hypothetical protein
LRVILDLEYRTVLTCSLLRSLFAGEIAAQAGTARRAKPAAGRLKRAEINDGLRFFLFSNILNCLFYIEIVCFL